MSHFAQQERNALCDLFLEVGAEAPTLCEGWLTADLAAHLVVRERRPDAAVGILGGPLSRYTERVQRAARDSHDWNQLVSRVRSGPPLPLRPADEAMNTVEYFVHHEDVRRAAPDWEPRDLDPQLAQALWSRLQRMGWLMFRRAPVGVVAEVPNGAGSAQLKRGSPAVTVRGEPGELMLWAFGRGAQAKVAFDGDEISVERLRSTNLGF